jgi:imidazolonepropionase-like amidohydrolase
VITTIGTLALAAAACLGAPAGGGGDTTYVRATTLDLGGGKTLEGGVVAIEGGKIRDVGALTVPDGAVVFEYEGVLTPGMIACRDASSVRDEINEPTRAVLPAARVVDAFDSDHPDLERALRAGITSLVLAPAQTALVGGTTATVKTAGGAVVVPEAHLALSLARDAQFINRFPTSAGGALTELNRLFDEARGPFARAAKGALPVLIAAGEQHEVARALAFAEQRKLRGALVGGALAGDLASEVAASGLGVVVGPFSDGASSRALRSAVALADAGVPLAFALDAPWNNPENLRLGAALLVREGLAPDRAWSALTGGAAKLAGAEQRIGALAKGLDADFVIWSGPPLDLGSRVVAVYVDGSRVYGGDQ